MSKKINEENSPSWTFLSNHTHVLVCLSRHPDLRLRDIADMVGITERAVFAIVNDLEDGGYLKKIREGRRNRYQLNVKGKLRHPLEQGKKIGDILKLLSK